MPRRTLAARLEADGALALGAGHRARAALGAAISNADADSRPLKGSGEAHGAGGESFGVSGSRIVCGAMRLVLPYPPSTNALYRNARARNGKTIRVKTQAARAYQAAVERYVQGWLLEFGEPPAPPYRLTIALFPPTARRIDVSNGIKCLEDGVFLGLRQNDRLVNAVAVRAQLADRMHPRAEVTLEHDEQGGEV
jgi:Holliday junction resolvase RusA-like endonuclease